MAFRRSATWMEQIDDRILEHMDDEPWSSPSVMASLTEFSASRARLAERCRLLADAGLIAPVTSETYEITTWGMRYLDGEIDAQHQPRPSLSRQSHRANIF